MIYVALLLAVLVGLTNHWVALPVAAWLGWTLHRHYTLRRFRASYARFMAAEHPDDPLPPGPTDRL